MEFVRHAAERVDVTGDLDRCRHRFRPQDIDLQRPGSPALLVAQTNQPPFWMTSI